MHQQQKKKLRKVALKQQPSPFLHVSLPRLVGPMPCPDWVWRTGGGTRAWRGFLPGQVPSAALALTCKEPNNVVQTVV